MYDATSYHDSVLEIHPGIVLKGQLSMVNDIVLTGHFEGDLKTLGRLTVSAGASAVGSIEAGALVLAPSPLRRKGNAAMWPLSLKKLKEIALGHP